MTMKRDKITLTPEQVHREIRDLHLSMGRIALDENSSFRIRQRIRKLMEGTAHFLDGEEGGKPK